MNTDLNHHDISLWLGSQASFEKILASQEQIRARADGLEAEDGYESRLLSVTNGIGVIDVKGSLTSEDSFWNQLFGITSYNEIRNAIIEAVEDEDVNKIVLDIDSPGGDAAGVAELSEFIKKASNYKPIETYVSGSAFSAAYWIASATDRISGPRMSEAGSIGVLAVLAEMTEAYKRQGVKLHVFRGGKYKAIGNPYEKLSDKSKSIIQGRIDKAESFFLDAVSENRDIPRSKVKSQVGEGLTFFADEAVENGLMDEIISFDELFGRLIKSGNSNSAGKKVLTEDLDMMKKKVLTQEAVAAASAGASEEVIETLLEDDTSAEAEEAEADNVEAAEEETETETAEDEQEETTASDEEEEVVEQREAASDDSLVVFLKEEVEKLRVQNSELAQKVAAGEAAVVNETALKKIANEYISNMCISLGISAMNMAGMDTSTLLTQYEQIRGQFTEKFKVGSTAEVKDEDESASSGDGLSPVKRAIVRANEI